MFQLEAQQARELAKYEPSDGKCIVFIGQDMEAIGGLEGYNGYSDYFQTPGGVTVYSNFSPGDNSFGFINKGNDGIKSLGNWGAGDNCAQCYVDNDSFKNSAIAIGLSLVNHEKEVANGTYDHLIKDLAEWIKASSRPIFLRIGYEFDGWDWNHYQRKHYLNAWKRIKLLFDELEVANVALVWQSKGTGSDQATLEKWYPGDDIVDWCGYSYFGSPDEEMIQFARKRGKPVFIAEATPVYESSGLFFNTKLSEPDVAKREWDRWFLPFFKTIEKNSDVVKAFSYINTNWSIQPMWIINPVFKKVDSRIQASDFVAEKWKSEISKSKYLNASDELFSKLRFEE